MGLLERLEKERNQKAIEPNVNILRERTSDIAKTGLFPQYQKTPEFVRSNVDTQLDFASSIDKQKQLQKEDLFRNISAGNLQYVPAEQQKAYDEGLRKQREIDQRINDKMLFSNITGALLGDKAGQAVRKVEEPFQNLMETTRNAYDFGIGGTIGSFIDPTGYEARKQLQERNPMTSTAGNIIGSLQPGALVEQGILKSIPRLATRELSEVAGKDLIKRVGMNTLKNATSAGLAGAGYGAIEGTMKGIADRKSLPEIAQEAGTTAGMYGLGGAVLGGGIGAIGQTLKGANVALNQSMDNLFSGYRPSVEGFAPVTPPKYIPANVEGKFTYKAPTAEVRGEMLQRIPATLKRPNVPQPEVLGLPAPVYKQPPVKPENIISKRTATVKQTDMNLGEKERLIDSWYKSKAMSKDDLLKMRQELNNENGKIFQQQIDWMKSKSSMGNKPNQGSLIRDLEGEVINRQGRTSNNELWYQEFANETKVWDDVNKKWKYRKPTVQELKDIAEKQLIEGYGSVSGEIPKNNNYLNNKEMINIIDNYISKINKGEVKILPKEVNVLKIDKNRNLKQYNQQMKEYNQQSKDVTFQRKTGRVENKDFTTEQPFKATPGELAGYNKNIKPSPLSSRRIVGDVNILRRTPVKSTIETGNLRQRLNELRGGERVTGEYIPPESTASTRVKSSREVPDIANMSKVDYEARYGLNERYSSENVNKMVQDTGARVINKVGSDDVDTIVKHYQKKYNTPEITITYNKGGAYKNKAGSTEKIGNGYKINLNPDVSTNATIEGKIGTLRHEIEHVIDLKNGYTPPKQGKLTLTDKRKLFAQPTKEFYANRQAGEHKNYKWFEADYLRRASIKDAIKEGRTIPKEILDEFPDLKNVKPSKDINVMPKSDNAQATTSPINNVSNINSRPTENTGLKNDSTIGSTQGDGRIRERGGARSERTNPNSDKALRENLTNDKLEYMQLGNKGTYSRAKEIFDEGYEKALDQFNSIEKYQPHDVPLAHMIANEAAKRGDIETARSVIAKISEKLTEAGQFGQANSIMRKSDPATFYRYIQKEVNKLNNEISLKYGAKANKVKLSDDIVRDIYNLEIIDENSMAELIQRSNRDIAKQMPSNAWEKLSSYRRMSMLLNPLTWIKNTLGNAFMIPLRKTADTTGMILEKIFLKPGERTKSIFWSKDKNLVEAVKKDWVDIKNSLMNNSKYGMEGLSGFGDVEKQIFKKGWITKQLEKITGTEFGKGKLAQSKVGKKLLDPEFESGVMEALNNISRNSLNWQDEIFMGRAYRDALGQYMKANKLSKVTEQAREYASGRALEATFRQTNDLASAIASLKRKKGIGGKAVDVALPFTKTPLNIAKTGFEYSPAGILKTLFNIKSNPQVAIESLAKGMTGTGVMGLGLLLGNYGWARVKADKSRNAESLNELSGEQPFSIITPIGSYTYDWNQPTALPFVLGVSLAENISKYMSDENSIPLTRAIAKSISDSGESFVNMTVLKNFKDIVGGGYGTVTEALATLPVDMLSQMIPSISGQIARSVDNTKRITYDPNYFQEILNTLINKVPGASMMLPAKIDVLGDEVKNAPAWQQFLSPGKAKGKVDSELVNELDRLYESGDKNTDFLPKNFAKTFKLEGTSIYPEAKEIEEAQRTMGEMNKRNMQQLINMNEYKQLDDTEKRRVLKSISEITYTKAKQALLDKRGIKTEVKDSVIPVKSLKIVK